MDITVKLFASLQTGRFAEKKIAFADGTTVREVIRTLKLPENEVYIIFVNSRFARPEQVLSESDTLAVFPMVGGG